MGGTVSFEAFWRLAVFFKSDSVYLQEMSCIFFCTEQREKQFIFLERHCHCA